MQKRIIAWLPRFVGIFPTALFDRPALLLESRIQIIRIQIRICPSVFWFVGGTNPETYRKAKDAGRLNELPVNHSPLFAPVIHPTLQTGVEALVVASQAWTSPQSIECNG